jgi:hypothetical protein
VALDADVKSSVETTGSSTTVFAKTGIQVGEERGEEDDEEIPVDADDGDFDFDVDDGTGTVALSDLDFWTSRQHLEHILSVAELPCKRSEGTAK